MFYLKLYVVKLILNTDKHHLFKITTNAFKHANILKRF